MDGNGNDFAKRIFDATRDYLERNFKPVADKVKELEAKIKSIPAGAKGEPGESIKGDKGDKGDPGLDFDQSILPPLIEASLETEGFFEKLWQRVKDRVSLLQTEFLREAFEYTDGLIAELPKVEKGEPGDRGPPGESVKGDKGDKGDPGEDVDPIAVQLSIRELFDSIPRPKDGDKGEPGKGEKGDPGERGPPGENIKGDKGDKGEDADPDEVAQRVAQIVPFPELVSNAVAKLPKPKDGDKGEPGESVKGDPGERGPPGESIKGDKGDKGDPGRDVPDEVVEAKVQRAVAAAVVDVVAALPPPEKGDKGDPGESIKGDKGDPGAVDPQLVLEAVADAISKVEIPCGEKGEPGESVKGDKGDPGEKGPAPDPEFVREAVAAEVAKLPPAAKGDKGEPGESVKGDKGEPGENVDPEFVKEAIAAEVAKLPPAAKGDKGEPGESIKGDKGEPGEKGVVDPVLVFEAVAEAVAQIPVVKGEKGDKGDSSVVDPQLVLDLVAAEVAKIPVLKGGQGDKGNDGLSAFQIAAKNGFAGTEEQWLLSLKGKDGFGRQGEPGPRGKPGDKGKDGTNVDMALVTAQVQGLFEAYPKPKDGTPGKDVDMAVVESRVYNLFEAYPKPKDGAPGKGIDDPDFVRQIVAQGYKDFFDQLSINVIAVGGRDFTFSVTQPDGKTYKAATVHIPVVLYRGIWTKREYEEGDQVTRDGSIWNCMVEKTTETPGNGSSDWVLSAKRGKDGKDGSSSGPPTPPPPVRIK